MLPMLKKKFICPFCMKIHATDITECPEKNVKIPHSYIKSINDNIPIIFNCTIGFKEHGKTYFLSSLFHILYNGELSKKWDHFSFLGLNQETLNKIHELYVTPLEQGNLPPKTSTMFPEPLIIKFQNFPTLFNNIFKKVIKKQDIIFVFYDIGGDVFSNDYMITQQIPIILNVNPLIFLIDLPDLFTQASKVNSAPMKQVLLLINIICNTLSKINQKKEKDVIIGFTKADLMWNQVVRYGPLAQKMGDIPNTSSKLPHYIIELKQFSQIIKDHFYKENPEIIYTLNNNFRRYCFTSFSALGKQYNTSPTKNEKKINRLVPKHVFNPILWTLILNGYL